VEVPTRHEDQLKQHKGTGEKAAVEESNLLLAGGAEAFSGALIGAVVGVDRHAGTHTRGKGPKTLYVPL
jgi:hypothetical protein